MLPNYTGGGQGSTPSTGLEILRSKTSHLCKTVEPIVSIEKEVPLKRLEEDAEKGKTEACPMES